MASTVDTIMQLMLPEIEALEKDGLFSKVLRKPSPARGGGETVAASWTLY